VIVSATGAIGVVLTAVLIAVPVAGAQTAGPPGVAPRILALEYYEDREDGFRYNVVATVKGRATEVRARSGDTRARGRLSGHITTTGPGKLWFFRGRSFVRAMRRDLADDGTARVGVAARGDGGQSRKGCRLELGFDPIFGESATGDCRRAGR
jgi:hypothetical protein